ncbi:MAG TPA: hypothetical protein VER96_08905 [Polyangiaceae bacterium]|nr:hypothetical protein [Polyangiaceae bacterium]
MADPRIPVAGRYAFAGALKNSQALDRWIGVEQDGGRRVVLAVADAGRLTTLDSARGVKHRHLTSVLEIARDVDARSLPSGKALPPGFGVAVAEFVPGTTLHNEISRGGMNAAKAVAWILRLADALLALHGAGAVHGALSPRSVIAVPEGRAIAPVLSQLVAPAIGGYCPPERLKGSAETAPDDVWALHATLYTALTRQAPYSAPTREALNKQMLSGRPKPLSAFGIDEPALQEILDRGLAYEKRVRVTELPELIATLDGWERDPRAMPAKRQIPPRPATRPMSAIVTPGSKDRDDGIVIDGASLADDEGVELEPRLPPPIAAPLPAPVAAPLPPIPAPPPRIAAPLPAPMPAPVAQPVVAAPPAAPSSPFAAPAVPAIPDMALDVPLHDALGSSGRMTPSGVSMARAVPAVVPPIKKRFSINPFERKRSVWPLVLIAAVVGGGGVYLAVAPDAPPPQQPKAVAAPAVTVPKATQPAGPKLSPAERRDACVASYFEPGSFEPSQNFSFVCDDGDFKDTVTKLQRLVRPAGQAAGGAPDPAKPDATVRSSGLDWYELPATAIIRKSCCEAAAPVTLPQTPGWCEQLQGVVRRIADDSSKAGDLAPATRGFDKAVACLFANHVGKVYGYEKAPTPANREAFQQFLSRAAISEARR